MQRTEATPEKKEGGKEKEGAAEEGGGGDTNSVASDKASSALDADVDVDVCGGDSNLFSRGGFTGLCLLETHPPSHRFCVPARA